MREELKALQTLNVRLTQKASEVDEELKKTKQELEQIKVNKSDSDVIKCLYYLLIYQRCINAYQHLKWTSLYVLLYSIHMECRG